MLLCSRQTRLTPKWEELVCQWCETCSRVMVVWASVIENWGSARLIELGDLFLFFFFFFFALDSTWKCVRRIYGNRFRSFTSTSSNNQHARNFTERPRPSLHVDHLFLLDVSSACVPIHSIEQEPDTWIASDSFDAYTIFVRGSVHFQSIN